MRKRTTERSREEHFQLKGIACPKSQDEDQLDVNEEQRKIKFARTQKRGTVLEERQMASHDRAAWAMEQSLECILQGKGSPWRALSTGVLQFDWSL